MNSRDRVLTSLHHREPDRVPVDFLATPEIWQELVEHFQPDPSGINSGGYFDPKHEAILRKLEVDCRLISYDMYCNPPQSLLKPGSEIDWWDSLARSSPNRMWRQKLTDGTSLDIWGHHTRNIATETGSYEEYASWPLQNFTSVSELSQYAWPEPDWWDFSHLRESIELIDPGQLHQMRFRAGTIFESAWQLRGMEEFLMDLAINPDIPLYIMSRLTEVIVENTRRVLEIAGDLIDMVYFYDDVGAQNGLMLSKNMWRTYLRPQHQKIIEVAKSFGKQVIYHSDGAIYPLLGELIDLGIDVLDPIQPTAKDMAPSRLKEEFGERLSFHGGIDIVGTLPHGTPEQVMAEVVDRVRQMGAGGGYILSSSHHIQSDTPLENVLAMYKLELRYR